MVVDFRSHLLNFDYRPTITKWGSHTATQEDNPSQRQLSLQKQLTGFWNKPVNAFLTQINDNILSLWKKHPVVSSATTLLRNTLLEKKLPSLYHRDFLLIIKPTSQKFFEVLHWNKNWKAFATSWYIPTKTFPKCFAGNYFLYWIRMKQFAKNFREKTAHASYENLEVYHTGIFLATSA